MGVTQPDYLAVGSRGRFQSDAGDAPDVPSLTLADDETGSSFTATVDGTAGATHTLYYRKTNESSWTEGDDRTGDGDISASSLSDDTGYLAYVVSSLNNQERASGVEYVKVTDGGAAETPATVENLPLYYLQQTVAACSTFQSWVGAANKAEAAESVLWVETLTKPSTSNYALVRWADGEERARDAGGTRSHFIQNGELVLLFRSNITADTAMEGASKAFTNKTGEIRIEMEELAGTAGYLDITRTAQLEPVRRPSKDEMQNNTWADGTAVGDFLEKVYSVGYRSA